jgi:hypothetical protein
LSIGTELKQLVQDTLFGRGAIGGTPQPHAGHVSRTGWPTHQPPMGGQVDRSNWYQALAKTVQD